MTEKNPAATVTPMRRTQLLVVLVVIGGLLAGYILRSFLQPAPVATPTPIGIPDTDVSGPPVAGWCCTDAQNTCLQDDSALGCLDEGGLGFHKTKDGCDKLCRFLSSQR